MSDAVVIRFLPDDITVTAFPGQAWLEVAQKAGIDLPTGCLQGSCGACTVDVEQLGEVRTCISAIPTGYDQFDVYLFSDPTW